jgi:hypothetical protein
MNNNNHFNTNNWIGTTHLDFFKNSSNALSNYTSNTSNILENHILINSNINYLFTSNSSNSNIFFTSNTSNLIIEKYDELIKEEIQEISFPLPATLKHTYIYNKNNGGEIRFQNKSYITDTTGFPPGTPNYKVKVDIDGKLKLFWVYDPLVSLIYLGGWHEPISEIAGLVADSVNQGGLITGLEGQIVINKRFTDSELTLIWAYIEGVQAGIITPGQTTITPAENARDMLTWGTPEIPATPSTPLIPASPIQNANAISTFNQRIQQLSAAREVVRTSTIVRISDALYQYVVQNPLTSFVLGTGFTSAGIAYAILQGIEYNRYYTGVIEGVIDQNSNLSAGVRLSLHNINQSNIIASNLIDYCSNTYNFGISQGFTNSNIIATQYLNSINTNEIKMNNLNFSNIFVASNVLDTTSNTLSNLTFNSSNDNSNYTSNSSNINFNYASNLIFNSSNNLISNYANNIRLILPNTNFIFDGTNNIFKYDLDISKYVPFKLIQQSATLFIKTRIFRITTFLSTDFNLLQNTNLNNLTGNPICYPETLLIYMSNDKNISGIHTADDNICNGLIYGKQNANNYAGYWNIVPTNFNYLRFITGVGYDLNLIIEPLLF